MNEGKKKKQENCQPKWNIRAQNDYVKECKVKLCVR